LIPVALWDAFHDAVPAQAAKVVTHPCDGIVGWIEAQPLRQQRAHFLVVEATQWEAEHGQKTPVGLKADGPHCGQIVQPFADAEVTCVVDRGFGAQRPSFRRVAPDDCSSGAP
jgi:hypothetical protein